MKTILTLLVLTGALLGVSALSDICSKCSCYPRVKPVTIYCNCNKQLQRVTFSPGDLRDVSSVKKFTVSFCQSVEFLKNSFAEAGDLVTLNLQQVETASIRMGVFSALKMLVVEDVADLRLEKRAFMGVDELRNVEIRRTTVQEIPEHALYDIKNLYSVELEDVVINTIRSGAVRLQMDEGYPMNIDHCTINHVEENGLVLMPAREFHLKRTNLTSVAKNGVNITSRGNIVVSDNRIGANITSGSIHISGQAVEISNNTLEHLPKNFLSNIQGPLNFNNNTLLEANMDLSDLGSLLLNANSTGNKIPCLCSHKTTMSFLSMDQQMAALFEQNLCIAPCVVSLRSYPEKCPKSTSSEKEEDDLSGRDLCRDVLPSRPVENTTSQMPPTARRPAGRALSPHNNRLVTPAPQHSGVTQVSAGITIVTVMLAALLQR